MADHEQEAPSAKVVFLLDVDDTLLDNDAVEEHLRGYLGRAFGPERQQRFWEIFEELRGELGYADFLGALQRFRVEDLRDPHILATSRYLLNYPFGDRVYPGAFDAIAHLRRMGTAVILSDGDVVFQPHKIVCSGLWDALRGAVLIYIHKEQMLDDVSARYPARHYVMVDDKVRILAAMKQVWGERLTTVFPRQGHYAHDPKLLASYPTPDITIERIADLCDLDPATLVAAAGPKSA